MEGHKVEEIWIKKRRVGDGQMDGRAESVFVNILRSPGIDSQPGGIDSLESIHVLHKGLQIRAQLEQG